LDGPPGLQKHELILNEGKPFFINSVMALTSSKALKLLNKTWQASDYAYWMWMHAGAQEIQKF